MLPGTVQSMPGSGCLSRRAAPRLQFLWLGAKKFSIRCKDERIDEGGRIGASVKFHIPHRGSRA